MHITIMENKSSKNKSSLSNLKTYYFLENINRLSRYFLKQILNFIIMSQLTTELMNRFLCQIFKFNFCGFSLFLFGTESRYIDIYKLCFLLRRKERKRQIGKLAMIECDILFQFTFKRGVSCFVCFNIELRLDFSFLVSLGKNQQGYMIFV